jgi:hypothetical protein
LTAVTPSTLGASLANACVDGAVERLHHDIVDDDNKGLAASLRKYGWHAELEAERRTQPTPLPGRLRSLRNCEDIRPLMRAIFKNVLFPSLLRKPTALFVYMYIIRLGLLYGIRGLQSCLYHGWFELTVTAMHKIRRQNSDS